MNLSHLEIIALILVSVAYVVGGIEPLSLGTATLTAILPTKSSHPLPFACSNPEIIFKPIDATGVHIDPVFPRSQSIRTENIVFVAMLRATLLKYIASHLARLANAQELASG